LNSNQQIKKTEENEKELKKKKKEGKGTYLAKAYQAGPFAAQPGIPKRYAPDKRDPPEKTSSSSSDQAKQHAVEPPAPDRVKIRAAAREGL
jgi:hypothetical protein